MKTYIIVYDDYKYGLWSQKYEAPDIFDAIHQFMCDDNRSDDIISITIAR
jgi:hypothetical protein